jgi:threonine synthase
MSSPVLDSPTYVDPLSGHTYPLSEPRWRSDTGPPLMITALPGIGRDMIDTRARSLWRYAAALPVEVPDPITMGEGLTPLISRRWRGAPALFKLEWFSPTGSFKDRGASVMVSILRSQGVTRLLEDSSGNGGAAIAAYAAAGGLAAKILVPASTPYDKTVQMRLRRRGRAHSRNASGRQRRCCAPSRSDLLRRPQLAAVLPAGNEDAGL